MTTRGGAATLQGIDARWETDPAAAGGLEVAVRALEIAAAGGHNLLLVGPAEAPKGKLARLLPRLLPPLSPREAATLGKLCARAGKQATEPLRRRPFRCPDCRVTPAGMVEKRDGPRPGQVSLAHAGVLFLAELAEFRPDTLSALQEALDEGRVTVGGSSLLVPARFSLVAAMTASDLEKRHGDHVRRLLDRFELQVRVPRIGPLRVLPGPGWSAMAARVARAREIQALRFGAISAPWNGAMEGEAVRRHCLLRQSAEDLLAIVRKSRGLPSSRAYQQVQTVARTVADLAEEPGIRSLHLAEALYFRTRGQIGSPG